MKTLNDEEACQLLLENYNQFYKNSSQIVYILGSDLRFIASNQAWINVWQPEYINPNHNIETLQMLEFLPSEPEVRQHASVLYERIIGTKKSTSILGINFFRKTEFTLMVFHVDAIINHNTGNLIGLLFKADPLYRDLSWVNLPKLLKQIFNLNCYATEDSQETKVKIKNEFLDSRAHGILFLMFHFSTYEEIACILSIKSKRKITKNAIGKYIRRVLYPQFSVIDNNGLKLEAAKLGYNKKIPPSLIHPVVIDLYQA